MLLTDFPVWFQSHRLPRAIWGFHLLINDHLNDFRMTFEFGFDRISNKRYNYRCVNTFANYKLANANIDFMCVFVCHDFFFSLLLVILCKYCHKCALALIDSCAIRQRNDDRTLHEKKKFSNGKHRKKKYDD